MTVAEFKRRMQAAKETGTPVKAVLYWTDKDGGYRLIRDFGERIVSIVQSNRFAMETLHEANGKEKIVNCWGEFPKATEFKELTTDSVECYFEGGKLQYSFK